jgi:hypothetical protein
VQDSVSAVVCAGKRLRKFVRTAAGVLDLPFGVVSVYKVATYPSKSASQEAETGGRIHQFLWRRSHAVSDAKQELSGKDEKETVLSRVK